MSLTIPSSQIVEGDRIKLKHKPTLPNQSSVMQEPEQKQERLQKILDVLPDGTTTEPADSFEQYQETITSTQQQQPPVFTSDVKVNEPDPYDKIINIFKLHDVEISSLTIQKINQIKTRFEEYKKACQMIHMDPFENAAEVVFSAVALCEYYLDSYKGQGGVKKQLVCQLIVDWIERELSKEERMLLNNLIDLTCETKQRKLISKACEVFNLSKRVYSACVNQI